MLKWPLIGFHVTEEGKKETGKLLLISVLSAKDAKVAPLHEGGSESRTGRQSGFGGNPDWNQLVSLKTAGVKTTSSVMEVIETKVLTLAPDHQNHSSGSIPVGVFQWKYSSGSVPVGVFQ